MNLNIISKATIEPAQIEQMIRETVEKQTGLKVKKITINVGTQSTGYGHMEHDETVFQGVTVEFETGPVIPNGPVPRHSTHTQWDR